MRRSGEGFAGNGVRHEVDRPASRGPIFGSSARITLRADRRYLDVIADASLHHLKADEAINVGVTSQSSKIECPLCAIADIPSAADAN